MSNPTGVVTGSFSDTDNQKENDHVLEQEVFHGNNSDPIEKDVIKFRLI